MIDPIAAIRTFMAQPAVIALVGDRIWTGDLPIGYDPSTHPCLWFVPRSGGFDYTRRILNPSCYVRMYGSDEETCIDLWRVCADAWQDRSNGIVRAQADDGFAIPRLLREQATQWLFALSGWTFYLKRF